MRLRSRPAWRRSGTGAGSSAGRARRSTTRSRTQIGSVEPTLHARALLWWVRLLLDQPTPSRDREQIVRRLGRGVELARESGDLRLVLFAQDTRVLAIFVTGDMAGAAEATAEGAALAATLHDDAARIRFDYRLAMLAGQAGRLEEAARIGASAFERAVSARDVPSMVRSALLLVDLPPETPGLPPSRPDLEVLVEQARAAGELADEGQLYTRLAWIRMAAGDRAAAAEWTLRGLDFAARYGAWHSSAYLLAMLVAVASRAGDDDVAVRLHASLMPLMTEVAVGLTGAPADAYRDAVEATRVRLGANVFDRLVAEGRLLGPAEAIALGSTYARRLGAAEPPLPAPPQVAAPDLSIARTTDLTPRELDILRELATGATNRQIAERLGLRPKTVMHHSVSIYSKLGLRSRTEAAAWAYRQGLLN